jgi:carboxymethylenebutenolidase
MEITEENVTFSSEDGVDIPAFVARPQEAGEYPGIILIHEIWGLNEQIRGVARRYAAEGYVVLAPHFFGRHGDALSEDKIRKAMGPVFALPPEQRRNPNALQELMETMEDDDRAVVQILFADRESVMKSMAEDMNSCYNFLRGLSGVTDKLGATGFCMGGGIAFQAATQLPLQATVVFYGANPTPIDAVANLQGPVFGIYAGEDQPLGAGLPALIEAMRDNKQTFGMKLYQGVQHGFFNETGRLYDAAAAEDAWTLTIAHFNRYLKA